MSRKSEPIQNYFVMEVRKNKGRMVVYILISWLVLLSLLVFLLRNSTPEKKSPEPVVVTLPSTEEPITPVVENPIESEEKIMYVMYESRLFDDKSFDAVSIDLLSQSTIVKVRRTVQGWCEVEVKEKNIKGWIAETYLKPYNPEIHLDFGLSYYYQDVVREVISLMDLGIDEFTVYGLMYTESRFNPLTTSYAGACGIMQVMPETWNYYYSELKQEYPLFGETLFDDMYNTRSSIAVGLYVLKRMSEQEGVNLSDDLSRVLTCYNMGCGGAYKFYKDTGSYDSEYSRQVIRAAEFIRKNKYWIEGM